MGAEQKTDTCITLSLGYKISNRKSNQINIGPYEIRGKIAIPLYQCVKVFPIEGALEELNDMIENYNSISSIQKDEQWE